MKAGKFHHANLLLLFSAALLALNGLLHPLFHPATAAESVLGQAVHFAAGQDGAHHPDTAHHCPICHNVNEFFDLDFSELLLPQASASASASTPPEAVVLTRLTGTSERAPPRS